LWRFSSARVKKWKFKFELSAANTMRFVPVNFGETECVVNQTDARDSLALSALPVPLAQARPISYSTPAGNRFRGNYLSHDLEVHTGAYPKRTAIGPII
jgi:hypothetical protein